MLQHKWTLKTLCYMKETRCKELDIVYGGGGALVSVLFSSLQSHRLGPARLLCSWDFSGKNTEVDCHSLLQGIAIPFSRGSSLPRSPALQEDSWLTEQPCWDIYCMAPFKRNIQIDKSKKIESGFVVYRDWGENEEWLLMSMDFFFLRWWKYFGIRQWWWLHNFVSMLKPQIPWPVNYSSIF